ncbi:MAG: ATP-binding protein [Desulfobacterales bacterium]|jgi:signal transduction histidine kinase|nr:ATP-binding protein [Desulfobacterales bacterium]
MIHWKHSISWRFFLYAMACFMAIVLVFSTGYALVSYHHEMNHVREDLDNISSILIPELIASLWVTDHGAVERIIDGITRFRYVARVEVRNDEGKAFDAGLPLETTWKVESRELSYDYKGRSVPVGTLSLFIDQRRMVGDVMRSVLVFLELQIFLSSVLAGVMAGAFHRIVGRHLKRLTRFIKADHPTQFDQAFSLQRRKPLQDELQLLVDHFNDLRHKISSYVEKLQAANAELTENNHRLMESERRLRESQAKILQLQKAESLGRMAGAVAHHYNNMLTGVMGNLELALAAPPGGAGPSEAITDALDAAHRAAQLGSLMLTYLGQTATQRKPLDLAQACRQVLNEFRGKVPARLTLKTDLPSNGPVVKGNGEQLRQVLENLFANAVEAFGERGGNISVGLGGVPAAAISFAHRWPADFQPGAADYACLQVADGGEGMAPDSLEKLFEPFYSTKFTGRGLGLAVALGIVKAHDGCITVETAPGKGSVFRVFLPVADEDEATVSDHLDSAKRREMG